MYEKNKKVLEAAIKNLAQKGVLNFINGKSVPAISGDTFDNHSPVDNAFICKVAKCDKEDVHQASEAASDAFLTWRKMPHKERRNILLSLIHI